jgi:thiol-disulfide isomerase/thioredoxin/protocatechuate 3,4-dioxygenase beta subunit
VDAQLTLGDGGGKTFLLSGWAKSDAAGRYQVGEVPSGPGVRVRAVISATGETTPWVQTNGSYTIALPDLVMRSPATAPATQPQQPWITYSGRVLDEAGKPISGALVEGSYPTGPGWVMDIGTHATDAQGRWSCPLPPTVEQVQLRFDHPDYVASQFEREVAQPPVHALRDGSAVHVMKRGQKLSGVVRDADGKPIVNALVLAGEGYSTTAGPEREAIEDSTAARTHADGTFAINCLPAGKSLTVAVTAEGFAPAAIPLTMTPQAKPLDVELTAGRTVVGRVVDEVGKPIAGATVNCDEWTPSGNFARPLTRIVRTKDDGRFEIAALPTEGMVELSAGIKGRLSISFNAGPNVKDAGDVSLYKPPVLNGKVLDDASGEPVKTFSVTAGWQGSDGRYSWLNMTPRFNGTDGSYSLKITNVHLSRGGDLGFAGKVVAKGYAPEMTPPVIAGQPAEPATVRLKKAEPVKGIVLGPDGKPVGRAMVWWVGPGDVAFIRGITLDENFTATPTLRTNTDGDGTFELPYAGAPGRLLVLHESGYVIVPTIAHDPAKPLQLLKWGRVEGVYVPGGKPQPNIPVNISVPPTKAGLQEGHQITFDLRSSTDTSGRFLFERVPAMECFLQTQQGPGPGAGVMRRLQPKPGETIKINLGEEGPSISGRIHLSPVVAANPPPAGETFDTSTSWIRAFRIDPRPEPPSHVDAADWEKQLASVLKGEASTDLTLPALFAELKPDGGFTFPAVAPGKYILMTEIRGPRPPNTCGWGLVLARGKAEFTVTDSALQLPTVQLSVTRHPDIGSPAPPITGKTQDGKDFSLDSHRGKYVALDFWAGWCAPCVASMPALKSVQSRHASEGNVAFVSLNFDYTPERAKAAVEGVNTPWTHVMLGPWDGSNPTLVAYGVTNIPSLWLIDPQGKVAAKDLTPQTLDAELSKRLGSRADAGKN